MGTLAPRHRHFISWQIELQLLFGLRFNRFLSA